MGSAVLLLSRFIGLQWDTSEAVRIAEEKSASASEAVDRLVNNVGTLEQRLAVAEESKTVDTDRTTKSADKETHSSVVGVTEDNGEESRSPIDGVRALEGGRGCDGDIDVDLPRCSDAAGQPAPSVGGHVTVDETEARKLHQPSDQNASPAPSVGEQVTADETDSRKLHQPSDRNAFEPAAASSGLSEAGAAKILQQAPARAGGPTRLAIDLPAIISSRDAAPRSSRPALLRPIGGAGPPPNKTFLDRDTGEVVSNGQTDTAATIPATAKPARDGSFSVEAMVGEAAAKRDETTDGDAWPRAGMQPVRCRSPERAVEGHTTAGRTESEEHNTVLAEPGQVFREDDAGGASDISDSSVRRGVSIPQEKEDDEEEGIEVQLATPSVSSADCRAKMGDAEISSGIEVQLATSHVSSAADSGAKMGDAEVSSGRHRNGTRRDNSRDDGDNNFSGRTSDSWTSRSCESHATSDRSNTGGRHDADHAVNMPSSTLLETLPAIRNVADRVSHRGSENERPVDDAGTREGDALLSAEEEDNAATSSMLPLTQRTASSTSPVPSTESDSGYEAAGLVPSASRALAPISTEDQEQKGEGDSDGEVSSRTPSKINSGSSRDGGDNNKEDFVTIDMDSTVVDDDDGVVSSNSCTGRGESVVAAGERSTDAPIVAAASPQAASFCDGASEVPTVDVAGQSLMSVASRPAPLRYSEACASGDVTGELEAIVNPLD